MADSYEFKANFIKGLACAAISPGLRGVLVFDITPTALQQVAAILAWLMALARGQPTLRHLLSPAATEDDLWGAFLLPQQDAAVGLHRQPGVLTEGHQRGLPQLVVIPDLTRIGLPVARACVSTIGADVATLARHGVYDCWQPDVTWLAGCASTQVGQLSPHLLDRFTLRLNGQSRASTQTDRPTELQVALTANLPMPSPDAIDEMLPPELVSNLSWAVKQWPNVSLQALERGLVYSVLGKNFSHRRDIALLQLATALARLANQPMVQPEHVDEAAQIINLKLPTPDDDTVTPRPDLPPKPDEEEESPPEASRLPKPPAPKPIPEEQLTQRVYESGEVKEGLPAVFEITPYPEDTALVEREVESLKLPPLRRVAYAATYGPIIGVEPSRDLRDLALVSTLLEATKFQPIRRQAFKAAGDRLLLSPADLRRYRRSPIPQQMLLLLLDYTCLRGRNWQATLLDYLRWAYVERASIALIQVGAANARHELQAERLLVSTLLSPRLEVALAQPPGRATPLAHGFELAQQTLRHAFQHGRSAIQRARLVVVTDGRGNVSLAASQTGQLSGPVNREGIDDALQAATQFHGLKHVQTVLLDPQPEIYSDLPAQLARLLAAEIIKIPKLESADF